MQYAVRREVQSWACLMIWGISFNFDDDDDDDDGDDDDDWGWLGGSEGVWWSSFSSSLEDVGASPPTLGASPPQITSSPKACRSPLLLWAHRPDLPPSPSFASHSSHHPFLQSIVVFLPCLHSLLWISCSISAQLDVSWFSDLKCLKCFAFLCHFQPSERNHLCSRQLFVNHTSHLFPIFIWFLRLENFSFLFQSRHRLDGDEQESLSGGYVGRISAPGACLLLCPSCPLMSSMSPQTHATQFKLPVDILTWCLHFPWEM